MSESRNTMKQGLYKALNKDKQLVLTCLTEPAGNRAGKISHCRQMGDRGFERMAHGWPLKGSYAAGIVAAMALTQYKAPPNKNLALQTLNFCSKSLRGPSRGPSTCSGVEDRRGSKRIPLIIEMPGNPVRQSLLEKAGASRLGGPGILESDEGSGELEMTMSPKGTT